MICPFAYGYDPHDLECRGLRNAEARLPWYRRLWHMLRGDYQCQRDFGSLPCSVHERLQRKGDHI